MKTTQEMLASLADPSGRIGLWFTRPEINGQAQSAMSTFLVEHIHAVSQPEFLTNGRGGFRPSHVHQDGLEGVALLDSTFGSGRGALRRLYFRLEPIETALAGREAERRIVDDALDVNEARSASKAANRRQRREAVIHGIGR